MPKNHQSKNLLGGLYEKMQTKLEEREKNSLVGKCRKMHKYKTKKRTPWWVCETMQKKKRRKASLAPNKQIATKCFDVT